MSIQIYLLEKGYSNFEGNCFQISSQMRDLKNIVCQANVKSVLEIGFNAGHSAELFLKENPLVDVVSFDIGIHSYTHVAKLFIDEQYPMRHTLILGDSTRTVPKYSFDNPTKTFDVIFIDGCHEYEIAKKDLENCRRLAHKDTIVIMDDTFISFPQLAATFNDGPNRAWFECIDAHTIKGIATFDYELQRGMSWGKYCLDL